MTSRKRVELPWQLWQAVKSQKIPLVSLALVVLVSYGVAVTFDFVNWDDPWYVIENPLIKSWQPENLQQVATKVVTRNYAPLTILSFLIDHTLYGLWAGGYHLTNVLLHLVNVVLAYLLVTRLSGNRLVGWATAAVFAIHPVQVETVVWISSRKGLLSGAFILASLWYWLRKERTLEQNTCGFVCFIGALLSKALAVVVPAIVFCYDYWVAKVPFREAVKRQIFPGCCALLLLVITMLAQTSELGGVRDHFGMSKLELLSVDSVIMSKYVQMLVWPQTRSVLYDPPVTGIGGLVLLAVVCWLTAAVLFARMGKREPLILFAGATFVLLLLPVLNLFPITTLMNDRYLYLPCIPFFGLLFSGVYQILERLKERVLIGYYGRQRVSGYLVPAVFGILVLALVSRFSLQTEQYLGVWKNGLSLWQYTSRQVPQLPVVQIQLANSYHQQGDSARAVAILRQALRDTDPDRLDQARIEQKLNDWQSDD
ncbi:hypothetical protein Enr10x_21750 [Gimesia panareensis]|uniref:Glycosyltransferase RgtA/B/C/D-like domain-containing protein n=1 Tax=Gimesia panareensis TaxID=2527978 RepID=A0A517Q5E9_9PLAN|nr:hypothetical protein [Gimesia panareensis]QDT26864.1 hypothetical protein Enr10x_21750 [Gimesia panareensis]